VLLSPVRHAVFTNVEGTKEPCGNSNVDGAGASLRRLRLPWVQMAAAQQYSFTLKGYGPLHDWVRAHTWRMHAPPGDHDVMVTNGNNQTIDVRPLPRRARPAALRAAPRASNCC